MRIAVAATIFCLVAGCQYVPGTDANVIEKAKAAAAASLRDPASAQFRSVRLKDNAVCGEMNGKNGCGAYAGFSRFVVQPDAKVITEPSGSSEDELLARQYFEVIWSAC